MKGASRPGRASPYDLVFGLAQTGIGLAFLLFPEAYSFIRPVTIATGILLLLAGLSSLLWRSPYARLPAGLGFLILALEFFSLGEWRDAALYGILTLHSGLGASFHGREISPEEREDSFSYLFTEVGAWVIVAALVLSSFFLFGALNPMHELLETVNALLAGFILLWSHLPRLTLKARAWGFLVAVGLSLGALMVAGDELRALYFAMLFLLPLPTAALTLGIKGVWVAAALGLGAGLTETVRDFLQNRSAFVIGWHVVSHGLPMGGMAVLSLQIAHRLKAYLEEKEEALRTLAEASVRDHLTGLHNHRYFQEKLEEEVERARRSGEGFSLVMVDLDDFKAVNDTHGHQAGDAVLRQIAERFREGLRLGDTVARYGGEEFALLLPRTSPAEAAAVVERIRQKLLDLPPVLPSGEEVEIGFSAGVASFPRDAGDKRELLFLADQALYQAKRKGKNRTCLASPRPAKRL
jgi:diguanylate cyclase (GGDEF)-like protein